MSDYKPLFYCIIIVVIIIMAVITGKRSSGKNTTYVDTTNMPHKAATHSVAVLVEYIEAHLTNKNIERTDNGFFGITTDYLEDSSCAINISVYYKGSDNVKDLLEICEFINKYITEEDDKILYIGDTPIFLQVRLFKADSGDDEDAKLNYVAAIANYNFLGNPFVDEEIPDNEYDELMKYIDIMDGAGFALSDFEAYSVEFVRMQFDFEVDFDRINVLTNMESLMSVYCCDSEELPSNQADKYDEIRPELERSGISFDYLDNRAAESV